MRKIIIGTILTASIITNAVTGYFYIESTKANTVLTEDLKKHDVTINKLTNNINTLETNLKTSQEQTEALKSDIKVRDKEINALEDKIKDIQ